MAELTRDEIVKRETIKYNLLHAENIKYGGRTGRAKAFLKCEDKFHLTVKKILSESRTCLDVGCGKGFFIDVFSKQFKNLKITGIDISEEAAQSRPDLHIKICSADKMPFADKQFDVSMHLDGMEHIPREIEAGVLKEIVRVTRKYIYMTIATHEVRHHDDKYEKMGLGAVHINMRSAIEWKNVILKLCETNNCMLIGFEDYTDWVHVLIEVG